VTSRRFRDAEQVEFETGLPVIGIFAKHGRAPQDVVISHPLSVEAESVHAVLAQIMSRPVRSDGPAGRVALVTSALPGEGKSSFCVALGRSAVRSGLSAFVLDCDLRRPAIERFVSKDRRKGNAVIESDLPLAAPAEQIAELMSRSGVDERSGLRYLSLANYVKNPHGLLAWPGLPVLIEYLRERYDLVLLDTPPVLAVADALKLGGLADKVLLMIGWIDTPRQAVAAAMRALQRANIAVTGAVMTKVDLRRYAKSSRTDGFYVHHYDGYHQPIGKTT
jgi:Mrp family chromosome partitioning ATPase